MWKTAAGIIAGLMFFMPMAAAQFARQEIVTIQSMTISDNDFLKGKTEGKPVTIAGRLLLPKATPDAKQPAVHPHPRFWWHRRLSRISLGMGARAHERGICGVYARQLYRSRDRFHGRGSIAAWPLQRDRRCVSSARHLAKHRNIDAGKIAVMGFSRGGQSSTYSNLERSGSRMGRRIGSSQPTSASMPAAAGLSRTTTR